MTDLCLTPGFMMAAKLAFVAVSLGVVLADVYDVVLPKYSAPKGCTCMPWANVNPGNLTEQSRIDSYWLAGYPPADVENSCAMPAVKTLGHDEVVRRFKWFVACRPLLGATSATAVPWTRSQWFTVHP